MVALILLLLAWKMASARSKKYPKPFIFETQQGADIYPLYRRRSPEDGGQVAVVTINVRGSRTTQEVYNRRFITGG